MRGNVERAFLSWARPLAPLLCIVVYGIVELARPETPADRILPPLVVSVAAGAAYRLLLRPLGARRVLQLLVVADTILIAAMTVALREPEMLAIAYFWSIAIAAFFLGARETVAATSVAVACAAIVPFVAGGDARLVVVVTDCVVLALIGGLLALLSRQAREADETLLAAARLDATVLQVSQQIRSSLEVTDVLEAAVAELGRATGSARGLVRLLGERQSLHQWTRPGVAPAAPVGLPPTVARVAVTGRPFVVERLDDTVPPEVAAYMRDNRIGAFVAIPVFRHDEVVAVLGLHHDRPRRWGSAVELVRRVAPQIGIALSQAEAYEDERRVASLRERLIANVSHELRTPLTSTIGFLQTLQARRDQLEPDQEERFLAIALEQAERLARLVEDLLDLSGLEGRPTPPSRPVPVLEAVERAARELAFDGRRLTLDVPSDLQAQADDDRLVQVFSNLLRNALVHGTGEVRVAGSRENGRTSVVVTDEGPGIPERLREEVFVPFARWNDRAPGTGLGLPISRAIVESYGGTLVYDGRFVVTLPAA